MWTDLFSAVLSLVWRSSSTSFAAQVWRVAYTAWYETDQWKAQCKADAQSKIVKTWADLESRLCWSDKWCSSYSIFMWQLDSDLHWFDKIVTAIHMTVTVVWYDMTNDSDRLMTLTVLTQWDAWQIEYDMWIDEASWGEVNEQRLTRDSWPAVKMMSSVDEQLTSNSRDEQTLMTWQYWRAGVDEQRRLRSALQQC